MSSQGPLPPGLGKDDSGFGSVGWTGPSDALTSNDIWAFVAISVGNASHYLKLTNYGFTIPGGSIVTDITLSIERHATVSLTAQDDQIRLCSRALNGTFNASTGTVVPTSDAAKTYGGMWSNEFTDVADINDVGFGCLIAYSTTIGNVTVDVDVATITITYADPIAVDLQMVADGHHSYVIKRQESRSVKIFQ